MARRSNDSAEFLTMMHAVAIGFTVLLVAACGQGHAAAADSARADSLARATQDSVNRAQPGYIVDSILPMDEQLRRFRAGLGEPPREFIGGEDSAEDLVQSVVRGVEYADTTALVRLTISRTEFAYLVFPESPFMAPPYRQAPDLVWMRHSAASATGLKRLLDRMGGSPLGFRSWSCRSVPIIEGKNRIWRDCAVRVAVDGGTEQSRQLFAGIIERNGRYKILSYANDF